MCWVGILHDRYQINWIARLKCNGQQLKVYLEAIDKGIVVILKLHG